MECAPKHAADCSVDCNGLVQLRVDGRFDAHARPCIRGVPPHPYVDRGLVKVNDQRVGSHQADQLRCEQDLPWQVEAGQAAPVGEVGVPGLDLVLLVELPEPRRGDRDAVNVTEVSASLL